MSPIVTAILRVLAALGLMLANGVVLIYMLRKVLGHLHIRLGPMHVGWHGVVQTTADVLKLLTKEDPTPRAVDRALFFIAPAVVFVPSLMAYAAIPFSQSWSIVGLETGLLYTFAVLSFVPIGILMSGWASANKWSLLGGMRAAAQQIAYEVPLLLAVLPVVMLVGSANLGDIVASQAGWWFGPLPHWFVFPLLPSFLLFFIAALIELNQTPFDMSEAESELVGGFSTEYSAMKFGLLFLAEFSNMFVMSALGITVFFGGWHGGFGVVPAPIVFMVKTYVFIFVIMWIRGTLPRVRIDRLMSLGWKALIPTSLALIMVTGLVMKVAEAVSRAVSG
jgi:NADH-quinone oxidoreductase subunit H